MIKAAYESHTEWGWKKRQHNPGPKVAQQHHLVTNMQNRIYKATQSLQVAKCNKHRKPVKVEIK